MWPFTKESGTIENKELKGSCDHKWTFLKLWEDMDGYKARSYCAECGLIKEVKLKTNE